MKVSVTLTYTSIVSQEIVCIALLNAALNKFDIGIPDVLNA